MPLPVEDRRGEFRSSCLVLEWTLSSQPGFGLCQGSGVSHQKGRFPVAVAEAPAGDGEVGPELRACLNL